MMINKTLTSFEPQKPMWRGTTVNVRHVPAWERNF